jgi:4-aminobutyrate aminotransferase-like enzyme
LRLAPPLVITEQELHQVVDALGEALEKGHH